MTLTHRLHSLSFCRRLAFLLCGAVFLSQEAHFLHAQGAGQVATVEQTMRAFRERWLGQDFNWPRAEDLTNTPAYPEDGFYAKHGSNPQVQCEAAVIGMVTGLETLAGYYYASDLSVEGLSHQSRAERDAYANAHRLSTVIGHAFFVSLANMPPIDALPFVQEVLAKAKYAPAGLNVNPLSVSGSCSAATEQAVRDMPCALVPAGGADSTYLRVMNGLSGSFPWGLQETGTDVYLTLDVSPTHPVKSAKVYFNRLGNCNTSGLPEWANLLSRSPWSPAVTVAPGAGQKVSFRAKRSLLPYLQPGFADVVSSGQVGDTFAVAEMQFVHTPGGGLTPQGCSTGCAGGPDCAPGGLKVQENSAHYTWSLGKAAIGGRSGVLALDAETPLSNWYSPDILTVTEVPGFKAVRDSSGHLIQAFGPNTVVVPVILDESAYQLQFYARQIAWTIGQNGTVGVSGSPDLVYEIRNPDTSGTTNTQLRVTQSPGGSSAKWSQFSYDNATGIWQLAKSDDPVIESLSKTNPDINNQYVKVRTRTLSSGSLVSKVQTVLQKFPWGDEIVQEIQDPDGAALTTTWTYYDNSATDGGAFGKIKQQISSSGEWFLYSYDNYGRRTKVVSGWLDSQPTDPENSSVVVENAYNVGTASSLYTTSMTVRRIKGTEVARSYHRQYWDGYDDVVCQTVGAAYDAADNLTTSVRYYLGNTVSGTSLSGALAGHLKSIIQPDGTAKLYSYSAGNFDSSSGLNGLADLTTVVKEGQPNAGKTDVVDGILTTNLTNASGHLIAATKQDNASGLILVQDMAQHIDDYGRPTEVHHLNGATTTKTYDCCHLASETDATGLTTSYEETSATNTTIRQGIRTKTTRNGLITTVERTGTDNISMELSRTVLDTAGRVYSTEDGSHHPTVHTYSTDASGHQIETVTHPDGGTVVTTRFLNGSVSSVTGTASTPVRYEYDVDAQGHRFSKVIALDSSGADTAEWTKTTTDAAGRTIRTENAAGHAVLSTYDPATGRLIKASDPDNVTTLYAYDGQGRLSVTALDLDRNGVIDYAGNDRVTRQTSAFATAHGTTVARTTTELWDSTGADTPVVASLSETAVSGLQTWQTAGGLTSGSEVVLAGNGNWTETAVAADGSSTVRSFAAGRLTTEQRKDSTGTLISSVTHRYDAHGREWQLEDGRGAQTDIAFDSADRVAITTGPAPTSGGARPVTQVTYTINGQQDTITDTQGGTTTYTYWPTGAVHTVGGNRVYPISYTYTDQGRMATMTTATGTTTWQYESTTGRLWKKLDATSKGEVYTYTAAGRILTRTNARGQSATYGYNNAGQVETVSYSDGLTPNVVNTYNRLGQPLTVASGGVTQTLGVNTWGQLETESYAGGPLSGLALAHGHDALRRRSSVAAVLGSTTLAAQGFAYDNASRLKTVTSGIESAIYGYDSQADLLTSVTFKHSGTTEMVSQRHFDLAGRLDSVKTLNAANAELFKADYGYNILNQRTSVTREDSTQWAWGYNDRGEVTSGGKKFSDGSAQPTLQYSYQYDGIGNRTQSDTGSLPAHTSTYSPNSLNQYTSRTVPPYLSVTGEAAADANVAVQAKVAQRKGSAFWKEWSVNNATGPVRENVRISAAKPGAGAGGTDLATLQTGQLYLPPATESFTYDDDGNLTIDSRWTYAWDAENRLLSMEEKTVTLPSGWVRQRLEFSYDAGSRRTRKTVKQWSGGAWTVTSDTAFVYDGWNLIAELDLLQAPGSMLRASYAWGLDISQSHQGAGGVGGLLWATTLTPNASTLIPSYDGNGNIIGYVDASSGQPSLKLDYDPFGVPVMVAALGTNTASTAAAKSLPFRFSTKYQDRETGLNYYGYRYYAAGLGRWINRDPLGERGGVNLYGMVANRPTETIDVRGLMPCTCPCTENTPDLTDEVNKLLNQAVRDYLKVAGKTATAYGIRQAIEAKLIGSGGLIETGIEQKIGAKGERCNATSTPVFKLCKRCVGADKLGHFLEEGLIYYDIAHSLKKGAGMALKFGQWTEGIAPKPLSREEWDFLNSPNMFVNFAGRQVKLPPVFFPELFGSLGDRGLDPNGDASPADLAANESGLKFWEKISAFKGTYEPVSICDYVNDGWDHMIHPNVIADPKPNRP